MTNIADAWITRADEASFNWPLTSASKVVEVGAYKGRWSTQIVDKYHCKVYAYEPQPWAFDELVFEAQERPSLIPFNYAIGTKDGTFPMSEWETDACSFMYTDRRLKGEGRMRDAVQVFAELGHIDLVLMNIEGMEYVLIPYMLATGITEVVDRICVQWHTFMDEDGSKYKKICGDLREAGYELLWDYFPTLNAWGK